MNRIYTKVEIQEDGTLKSVNHKVNCGATLLQLNGAGTKAALLHNSIHHAEGVNQSNYSSSDLKGHSRYNIDYNNNIQSNSVLYNNRNNIIPGVPFQGNSGYNSLLDQQAGVIAASAAPVTVMPAVLTEAQVDDAFVQLHLNDTNYIPTVIYKNNHKFKKNGFYTFTNSDERTLNGHLEIMYKCMLVQAFNYHDVYQHYIDPDCDDMIVTPEDIEKSLRFWVPKLDYPEKESDRMVTSFMLNITDDKIAKDYEIAKSSSWMLRKWFDGDNFTERLRINPDVQLLTIYEYGNKDISFDMVVTYDGDMCLKMPSTLRAELQAWYESNPRQCRKELTAMLNDKFCNNAVDANGEEHTFDSIFRSLKNRTVQPAREYTNAKRDLAELLDIYPSQDEAKSWILEHKASMDLYLIPKDLKEQFIKATGMRPEDNKAYYSHWCKSNV